MWKQIFIGKPLKLNSEKQQAVSKKEALALLSSDALSSVAYGPEQIILVLFAAAAFHSYYTLPVAGFILALLFLLVIAYRSVITQFPEGGGAYKVTQKYMNNYMALCTAGLLLVDYILTIAVSVSAGVDALTSAFPSLHASRIVISVLFIGGLLLLNLRGVTETARVLMFPVYGFIVSMLIIFIMALFKWDKAVIVTKWMVVWPVVIFVPVIIYGCLRIHQHYDEVAQTLTDELVFPSYEGQMMIIPISGIYQTTKKALAILELQQCAHMYALYIGHSQEDVARMKEEWAKFAPTIRLIAFTSSNQYLLKPLIRSILKLKALADQKNYHVIVAVPQLVTQKKWHAALHNHHAFALKQALLAQPDISVMTVPYSMQRNHDKG